MNKTIHRIWLNEEPPPPALQRIGESWEGEDVEFWDNERLSAIPNIGLVTSRISQLWGNGLEGFRALSDWCRVAILHDHGGLYVDMDCEKVGDVWDAFEARQDAELVTCRPIRPERLAHERPCNGVLYAPFSECRALCGLKGIIESRLQVMGFELEHGVRRMHPSDRPVHITGPDLLHAIAKGPRFRSVTPEFAAFKGCETPDTRIVIHQGWRKYDA